jgi:hypothetical protein
VPDIAVGAAGALFQLRRDRRKRSVEFGPKSLYDGDDRDGDAGSDQAIFDGGRGILVVQESDDQAHELVAPGKASTPSAFLYRKSYE